MEEFINKYRGQIHGTLSVLDRLVFRGSLRRLQYGRWDRTFQAAHTPGLLELSAAKLPSLIVIIESPKAAVLTFQ